MSSETTRKEAVTPEKKSCDETCEEELFSFTNKHTSLEDLKEETLKQVQEELYEDCRNEDIDDGDSRRWKRRVDYNKAWKVLENQFNDTSTRYGYMLLITIKQHIVLA